MTHQSMISFIIPAYNEEALIGSTIDAIHAAVKSIQQPYEVIVADDGSTDRTAEIAAQRGARIASTNRRQISAARNAGASIARGDVFIFVDADTILPEATLREAIATLNSGAAGGGGAARFDGRIPLYGRIMLPACIVLFRMLKLAAGCFVFCRRDVFHAVGGFDETVFAGEEIAFSRALKQHGRFAFVREPVITSGRKLRQYRPGEVLGLFWRLLLTRPSRRCKQRDGLDLWYEGRRETATGNES